MDPMETIPTAEQIAAYYQGGSLDGDTRWIRFEDADCSGDPIKAYGHGFMQCEKHPGVIWPHDDCPGPGMPLAGSPDEAPWLKEGQ